MQTCHLYIPLLAEKLITISKGKGQNRRFNLGDFLWRNNKGFNPMRSDEPNRSELEHLESDSEVEEYAALNQNKA